MGFQENLINVLKKDLRFVDSDSGELIRSEIINQALKIDKKLIEVLLSEKEIKEKFFTEIKGHWIFEINNFIEFIQDKNFLSDSYTKFKNKIGLNIGGKFLNERKEVSLVWPFKDCVLEGGMTKEDQKRNEIFFNEILAKDEIDRLFDPKVLTNFKKYTAKGEEKVNDFNRTENGTIKDNLIIKGNNLLALHSLKKEFQDKVKLIYIDPPYNTGGATEIFTYNNNFKHSTWLTFMKNRLEVAKAFLKDDGFIAITIDHVELFYLGALADEVFGEDNRIGIVTILINPKGRQHERFFSASTEYMLVYAKNHNVAKFRSVTIDEEVAETFDQEDEAGKYRWEQFIRARTSTSRQNKPDSWYPIYVSKDLKDITLTKKDRYSEIFPKKNDSEFTWKTKADTFEERNVNKFFKAEKENGEIKIFHKFYEQQVLKNIWTDKKYFPEFQGTNLLKKLLGENLFSYPKSVYAVLDTLKIMTSDNDIILDFFGGSGTTAHATLELNKEDGGNRQFILIEQLDTHMNVILKRIKKVMEINKNKADYFVLGELMKNNEEAVDKIQSAKTTEDLIKIWKEMVEHYFLNYDVDIKRFNDNKSEFEKLSLVQQKKLLCEMLNKNQLYVNLSEIDDAQFKVSKADKDLNKKFYK